MTEEITTIKLEGEALEIARKIARHRQDMKYAEERINSLFPILLEEVELPKEDLHSWGLDAQGLANEGVAFLVKVDKNGKVIGKRH